MSKMRYIPALCLAVAALTAGCVPTGPDENMIAVGIVATEVQASGITANNHEVSSNLCALKLTELAGQNTSADANTNGGKAFSADEPPLELVGLLDTPRNKQTLATSSFIQSNGNGPSSTPGRKAQKLPATAGNTEVYFPPAILRKNIPSNPAVPVSPMCRDMLLKVTPNRSRVPRGDTVWFTVTVKNQSTGPLKNIRLHFDRDPGLVYLRHIVRYDRTRWNRFVKRLGKGNGPCNWTISPQLDANEDVTFQVQFGLQS